VKNNVRNRSREEFKPSRLDIKTPGFLHFDEDFAVVFLQTSFIKKLPFKSRWNQYVLMIKRAIAAIIRPPASARFRLTVSNPFVQLIPG
jgi:hypothetical protein